MNIKFDETLLQGRWRCVSMADLRSTTFLCEVCHTAHVRFVHRMAQGGRIIKTGCVCAGRLERNPAGAQAREHVFGLREARRARWATKEWRRAKSGVSYLNSDGVWIRIYGVPGGFSGVIASLIDDWKILGRRVFSSNEAEAQSAAIKHLFANKLKVRAK